MWLRSLFKLIVSSNSSSRRNVWANSSWFWRKWMTSPLSDVEKMMTSSRGISGFVCLHILSANRATRVSLKRGKDMIITRNGSKQMSFLTWTDSSYKMPNNTTAFGFKSNSTMSNTNWPFRLFNDFTCFCTCGHKDTMNFVNQDEEHLIKIKQQRTFPIGNNT